MNSESQSMLNQVALDRAIKLVAKEIISREEMKVTIDSEYIVELLDTITEDNHEVTIATENALKATATIAFLSTVYDEAKSYHASASKYGDDSDADATATALSKLAVELKQANDDAAKADAHLAIVTERANKSAGKLASAKKRLAVSRVITSAYAACNNKLYS